MIPVLQTHHGGPGAEIPGNCMQAAIASLLELTLDDVPHFVQHHADPWASFKTWCARRGLQVVEVAGDTSGDLLTFGPTRRGIHHWVIYRDGKLLHDPAGSDGLFYAERFYAVATSR